MDVQWLQKNDFCHGTQLIFWYDRLQSFDHMIFVAVTHVMLQNFGSLGSVIGFVTLSKCSKKTADFGY